MSYFKRLTVSSVLILLVLLALNNFLLKNHFNLCTTKLYVVSDQKKYEAGIRVLLNNYPAVTTDQIREDGALVETYKHIETKKLVPYESVAAFLEENPNCCVLYHFKKSWGREGGLLDLQEYLFISYKQFYYNEDGTIGYGKGSISYRIDACGNVLYFDYS